MKQNKIAILISFCLIVLVGNVITKCAPSKEHTKGITIPNEYWDKFE